MLILKLLSVLNSDSKNIRLSFFITSIGIISSFLMLGLIFLLLRESSISISWGMQFQEPYFLIFILIIITFFSLNTLGFFEIRLPSILFTSNILNFGKNYYAKNFFNGFFATLLATPCSAPFIGTAITAAFTQSQIYLMLIFFTMGFGMSIPYLLIIAFPNIVLKLPKPGKWMNYVKYFLSLLLFLTALWILNILYSHFNYVFIISFFILLLITVISLKINFYQTLISSSAILLLCLLPILDIVKKNNNINDQYTWIDFNKISIKDYIDDNRVIFLDITADWCVTCQFNKINVINTKRMSEIFSTNDVILVKADWTIPNEKINNFLKKFNKFGIPFNAFYSKKHPNGVILSEILTQNEIETTLETMIK
ncbi:thioredoxin family protein [Pelagibacteraceae bacterium]|nr:thioredoxin family protein [Pelagibacteraceae bacterium]